MRLVWRPMALEDRESILDYIAQDNPLAAIALDDEFEAKAELARAGPQAFRAGRVPGTCELVVRPNYVLIYQMDAAAKTVTVLRVLHARQQWPAAETA